MKEICMMRSFRKITSTSSLAQAINRSEYGICGVESMRFLPRCNAGRPIAVIRQDNIIFESIACYISNNNLIIAAATKASHDLYFFSSQHFGKALVVMLEECRK
jgi:hypothetical protein